MYDAETFQAICDKADSAGKTAVGCLKVVPMTVGQETSMFSNEIDYTKPTYYVEDGMCGFAWVDVFPANKGNTKAGKEERIILKSTGFNLNDYTKTYQFWISDYNQSVQKKETYARAYAEVLRENGLKAYGGSRLD